VQAAGPATTSTGPAFDALQPGTARARPFQLRLAVGGAAGGALPGPSPPRSRPQPTTATSCARAQEVIEAQNETDIDRALQQWRENKTAVDAEIKRRIQAQQEAQERPSGAGSRG